MMKGNAYINEYLRDKTPLVLSGAEEESIYDNTIGIDFFGNDYGSCSVKMNIII